MDFEIFTQTALGATPKRTPAYAGVMSFPRRRELSVFSVCERARPNKLATSRVLEIAGMRMDRGEAILALLFRGEGILPLFSALRRVLEPSSARPGWPRDARARRPRHENSRTWDIANKFGRAAQGIGGQFTLRRTAGLIVQACSLASSIM
jgi:hypothetical protein